MHWIIQIIESGGWVVYLLLGCSCISLAVVSERTYFWIKEKSHRSDSLILEGIAFIRESKENELKSLPHTLIQNISSHINLNAREDDKRHVLVMKILDDEIENIAEHSFSHLSALATIVSIAPLLGVLGTVLGIIDAFNAIGSEVVDPKLVGSGLGKAMVTTAVGLCVAVPTLVLHNSFVARAKKHVRLIEKLQRVLEQRLHHNGISD